MKLERQKAALVRRFRRSGLPLSRFCLREGIPQATFRKWVVEGPVGDPGRAGFFQPFRLVESQGCLVAQLDTPTADRVCFP